MHATERKNLKDLFRKSISICHPDRSPPHLHSFMEAKTKELNAAYEAESFVRVRKIAIELGVKGIPPLPSPPKQEKPKTSQQPKRKKPKTSPQPKQSDVFTKYYQEQKKPKTSPQPKQSDVFTKYYQEQKKPKTSPQPKQSDVFTKYYQEQKKPKTSPQPDLAHIIFFISGSVALAFWYFITYALEIDIDDDILVTVAIGFFLSWYSSYKYIYRLMKKYSLVYKISLGLHIIACFFFCLLGVIGVISYFIFIFNE